MNVRTLTLTLAVVMLTAGTASAVSVDLVPVGDPGNAVDTTGYGGVAYTYSIGKYEVTAGQYTEFLNKVAGVDTNGLYSTWMSIPKSGSGITRSGGGIVGDPYIYSVAADYINRPVNFISWGDAARFCNWLNNGQPSGAQSLSTTEDGAYFLNGATSNTDLMKVAAHKTGAKYWIPSENEWYKAAYYKGGSTNAGYWLYPTHSNNVPGKDMSEATNPGNNANYNSSSIPIDSGHYTTIVGEFQLSAGPYGTFDQAGNVGEWIENAHNIANDSRCFRGGSFGTDLANMASSTRISSQPAFEDSTYGFRVASIPEPGSITLLAAGVVFGWMWRRCRMYNL